MERGRVNYTKSSGLGIFTNGPRIPLTTLTVMIVAKRHLISGMDELASARIWTGALSHKSAGLGSNVLILADMYMRAAVRIPADYTQETKHSCCCCFLFWLFFTCIFVCMCFSTELFISFVQSFQVLYQLNSVR